VRLVLVRGEMQTGYIEERNRNTSTLYEGIKRTTISDFMTLTHKKGPRHMTLEIQVFTWDRHKHVAGLNWLMGSKPSPGE